MAKKSPEVLNDKGAPEDIQANPVQTTAGESQGDHALRRSLGLDDSLLASLPPDVSELLIEHVQIWGDPREALDIAALLREAHGPLLHLLDVQAAAQMALGDNELAQQTNERRQRRSSTIASQAFDACALQKLGRERTCSRRGE